MDDLAGLDWSQKTNAQKSSTANYSYNASFSTLKPTPPTSGRATPLNASSQPPSKSATPGNDSFSNLVSFSSGSNTNLPLQEQQKRLAGLKLHQQKKQAKSIPSQYTASDDVWNKLGSGRSTPMPDGKKNGTSPGPAPNLDEDDMFSAFNPQASQKLPQPAGQSLHDDDPFGLSEMKSKPEARKEETLPSVDDDDFLGLLGQPVSKKPQSPVQRREESKHDHSQDSAVAELVEMGFPADRAQRALEATSTGTDVQSAVGWLLNQAHAESRERSQARESSRSGHSELDQPRRGSGRSATSVQRHRDGDFVDMGMMRKRQASSQSAEKDPAQIAAEFGNNFLKTAGSLWKQGTKKMQQAVQDFNADSDPSHPAWMRDAKRAPKEDRQQQNVDEAGTGRRRRRSSTEQQNVTNEALMLESRRPTPPPRPNKAKPEHRQDFSADNSRGHAPGLASRPRETQSQPAFLRQQQKAPQQKVVPQSVRLTRQSNDEQAAQAYVSSARRRTPAPAASESDLLEGPRKASAQPQPATRVPTSASKLPAKSDSIPARPKAPARTIPSIAPNSLQVSHTHRSKGNDHFKKGDYSSAHQSYSNSLSQLPSNHPITIVLLTNRALTGLKIGEPKNAIADCDKAISIIGVSKGEAEAIDFANGEGSKPMREYYGKALMRKAEALEQMERWSEAAAVWREAVEGGHGGGTAMQGRLRAEKAANPPPKPKSVAKKPVVPPRRSAAATLAGSSSRDSAAVSRLRAANAAATKEDDEKFALADSVDARLSAWKNGKQDNLRALLGSLDTVLWPEANWKKINMADLVLPAKVKIQYMKGIGKVHPDKIPVNASTEQRMISSAVFSTLNEAWDKFKTENNL